MAGFAFVHHHRWMLQAAWIKQKKISENNGHLRFHESQLDQFKVPLKDNKTVNSTNMSPLQYLFIHLLPPHIRQPIIKIIHHCLSFGAIKGGKTKTIAGDPVCTCKLTKHTSYESQILYKMLSSSIEKKLISVLKDIQYQTSKILSLDQLTFNFTRKLIETK